MIAPIYKVEDLKIIFMENNSTGACDIINNATDRLELTRDAVADKTYYHGIECIFNDTAALDGVHILDQNNNKIFELKLQDGLRVDLLSNWVRDNTMTNVL